MSLADRLSEHTVAAGQRSKLDTLMSGMSSEDHSALAAYLLDPGKSPVGIAAALRAEYPGCGITDDLVRKWRKRNLEVNGL